jgi:hypothetical protein
VINPRVISSLFWDFAYNFVMAKAAWMDPVSASKPVLKRVTDVLKMPLLLILVLPSLD